MLWSEFKDSFLAWLSVHGGDLHVRKAREVLGRFTRKSDPVQLGDIDQMMYNQYLAARKKDPGIRKGTTVSEATVNGDIVYLNMAFAYVDEIGRKRLGLDPDWQIPRAKKLRIPKRIPRGLSQNAMDNTFLSTKFATMPAIEHTGVTPEYWWTAFLCIALFTGIRKSGILALKRPTDEELNQGELFLDWSDNKSKADQIHYLPQILIDVIRGLPAKPGEVMLVWPHGYRTFYEELQRFQLRAGIDLSAKATPHKFRKTLATLMVRHGATPTVVQRVLGQSCPRIAEQFYIGDLSPEQRQAVDRVPIPAALTASMKKGDAYEINQPETSRELETCGI